MSSLLILGGVEGVAMATTLIDEEIVIVTAHLTNATVGTGMYSVKVLFHSIGRLDRTLETDVLPPKMGSGPPRTPDRLSPRDKMNTTSDSSTNQMVFTEYLAMFTHFRSHTRIIGKENLFDFTTIFTQLTAQSCTGQRSNL